MSARGNQNRPLRLWPAAALIGATLLHPGCSDEPTAPGGALLEIATATTGSQLDPDGYAFILDGGEELSIGINASATLSGQERGEHQVELTGVAPNCAVTGSNPRSFTAVADEATLVRFEIVCAFVLGTVAFAREAFDQVAGIHRIPGFDGTSSVIQRRARQPAWSPDGSRIAFTAIRDGSPADIFVMDADGSNPVNLTDGSGTGNDFEPAWSPDGAKIAFSSDRDGHGDPTDESVAEIYVMDADGSNPLNLTNDPTASESDPAWSPDGTRIAFTVFHRGGVEIRVMNADGSDPVNLTDDETSASLEPAWSPDGTQIAFTRSQGGDREVYVMNADGSNPVNLTNHPEADDFDPAWSPDGSRIAFTTHRDGNAEVYIMDRDGSNPSNLTNDPAADFDPAWSP